MWIVSLFQVIFGSRIFLFRHFPISVQSIHFGSEVRVLVLPPVIEILIPKLFRYASFVIISHVPDIRNTVLSQSGCRKAVLMTKKFTSSKSDGDFAITMPSVTGCRLEVSMMSFAKQSVALDSIGLPLTVYMEPGSIQLKEVAVKADRIREQGDTITYNVGGFAQQQDRSIGDVLKRMPGIDVANNGKIQYQGEDINKFYIEGSDLLGGKYEPVTDGIVIAKSPSDFDEVNFFILPSAPLTMTDAPTRGSLFSLSRILPVTLTCAIVLIMTYKHVRYAIQ